jgi:hypothetical protein
MRLALVQLRVGMIKEENIGRAVAAVAEAAQNGAQVGMVAVVRLPLIRLFFPFHSFFLSLLPSLPYRWWRFQSASTARTALSTLASMPKRSPAPPRQLSAKWVILLASFFSACFFLAHILPFPFHSRSLERTKST